MGGGSCVEVRYSLIHMLCNCSLTPDLYVDIHIVLLRHREIHLCTLLRP